MTCAACPRIREAESFVDGRLAAADHEAWRTHALSCRWCAEELREIDALREVMRALPALEASAMHVRTARIELVARVAGRGDRDGSAVRRNAYLMFTAAVVALVGFFVERNFLDSASRAPAIAGTAVQAAPTFDVANVEGAIWDSKIDGPVARSSLTRGVAAFHVEHLGVGQRFLLALPDGELEVHGTRFVVRVENGATTSVDVSEGIVLLRMHGMPERFVRAGEHWPTPAPSGSTPSAPTPTTTSAVIPPSAPTSTTAARVTTPPSAVAVPTAIDPTTTASASAPRGDVPAPVASEAAGARYIAATHAFQSGSYAKADALLAAFLRDFPRDPRCEDAAFLRAMAHARMGDSAGAATLARAYLRAYPNGFRRSEAAQLAGEH